MFVDVKWLMEQILVGNQKVKPIDCRFDMAEKDFGKASYQFEHIPNAIYFDLEKYRSSEVKEHGGRHPLPDMKDFQKKLEDRGICKDDILVPYDGGQVAYASRFAWMMKYVGHENVYILNGGFITWKMSRFPTSREIPTPSPSKYEIHLQPSMLASYEEVQAIANGANTETVLIDSRDLIRYLGIEETIDKKAGHIPTAVNLPYHEGLRHGSYLPKEQQEKRFAKWKKEQPIIVYCGSGVTATPNYFALKSAGYENVKLYVGSFSDWISYEENPIRTIEE